MPTTAPLQTQDGKRNVKDVCECIMSRVVALLLANTMFLYWVFFFPSFPSSFFNARYRQLIGLKGRLRRIAGQEIGKEIALKSRLDLRAGRHAGCTSCALVDPCICIHSHTDSSCRFHDGATASCDPQTWEHQMQQIFEICPARPQVRVCQTRGASPYNVLCRGRALFA